MALTASAPRCVDSAFMKDGAKVPEDEEPPLKREWCAESEALWEDMGAASEEYD